MKISASIYSNKNKKFNDLIKELDLFDVDYFHIDCNDDLSVFDDIEVIRKNSITPIDLHIISDSPEKFYDGIVKNNVELVTFQYENLEKKLEIPSGVSSKLGLALMTDTSIDAFDDFSDRFSFVLFMTTTPGQSGGEFDKRNFDKIREFKKRYPEKFVHVDGGVNDEVAFVLRSLGVSCAVSGSYLTGTDIVGYALLRLKTGLKEVHYKVKDFMCGINEIPVLNNNELDLRSVLETIEYYKMGFVFVVCEDGKLSGIVTDGDIRRLLLNNLGDLEAMKSEPYVNLDPLVINGDDSISKMFDIINSHKRPILFFPVIDDKKKLMGAVSFNNLVKGGL